MKDCEIVCVVGARPNFMKMSPILKALSAYPHLRPVLVHTGQHYDANLSEVFFKDLGIPEPDAFLEVGSGSHGGQTAKILERVEAFLVSRRSAGGNSRRVLVVGDVNSTMAASLAAVKLGIPVAHVEAGLRSFDRSMPEEINRIVTDSVADMLFVSEPAGVENLRHEGHPEQQIHLVGNVMIDTLSGLLSLAQDRDLLVRHSLRPQGYAVVTLHRPSNVDRPETLAPLLDVLIEVSGRLPMVFPVHPRTQDRIERFGLKGRLEAAPGIRWLPPMGYVDFLALTSQARLIVTDSGGLQEESTALGIPCLTARPNTERPITVDVGTSTLVDNDPARLREAIGAVLDGTYRQGQCPALWDGHAAERIAAILASAA